MYYYLVLKSLTMIALCTKLLLADVWLTCYMISSCVMRRAPVWLSTNACVSKLRALSHPTVSLDLMCIVEWYTWWDSGLCVSAAKRCSGEWKIARKHQSRWNNSIINIHLFHDISICKKQSLTKLISSANLMRKRKSHIFSHLYSSATLLCIVIAFDTL